MWLCFPGHNTEKTSQLSLVRRPSVAVSKCTTGDLKLNPQRVSLVSTPSFQGGLVVYKNLSKITSPSRSVGLCDDQICCC